jgi:hypothetical protein
MRRARWWDRTGAATGAAAVLLSMFGAMLGDPYRSGLHPDPTDPSPLIAGALVEIRDDARTGTVVGLVGAFLLIWFVGYLRANLSRREGAGGWLADVAHGGGVVAVALLLVSHSLTLAATELTDYGDDTVLAKVFLTHGWNYFYVVSPPMLALVAAASVAGLRFGALPRWLAILGLVMLVLPFLTGAGLGAMVGLLWVLLASVVLTIRTFRQPALEPPGRADPLPTP